MTNGEKFKTSEERFYKRIRNCTSMWDVSHMIIRDVDKED